MTVAVTTAFLSQPTAAAVGALVSGVVLLVLVLLCVCGDRKKKQQAGEVADSGLSVGGTYKRESVEANHVVIKVDPTTTPVENGKILAEPGSRSSHRSSGSSPQPGGQRELPAPPTASHNSTTPDDEDQEYDHLITSNNKIPKKRASNYDHIKVSPEGKVEVEEHKVKVTEHFYSEVKSKAKKTEENKAEIPSTGAEGSNYEEDDEGDYDTLNEGSDGSVEVKRSAKSKVKKIEDPYSRLKDEDSGGSFSDIDPYSKVKDDPYSRLKDDMESDSGQSFDPYSKMKDDPYSKVKDDPPYSRMKDDPYSKVKDDPYSRVKDDDPYNRVDDEGDASSQIDDPYNRVNENSMEDSASGTSNVIDAYASVEPKPIQTGAVTRINVTNNRVSRKGEEFSVVESSSNEYAVVMKSRSESTPTPTLQNQFTYQETDPYSHPPEPPRRYNDYAEPDDAILGGSMSQRSSVVQTSSQRSSLVQSSSQRSSVIQVSSPRSSSVQNGVDVVSPDQAGVSIVGAAGTTVPNSQPKREPPYHKITARESLASINQRLARNTYETVAETEADSQAEGGAFVPPEVENFYATVEGGSGDGVVTGRANRDSQSPTGDHYAEIGATGGRSSNVPAPPSLDSLHIMTKSAEGRLPNGSVSPKEDNSYHRRTMSDQGKVTLDPNYQTVRDCITETAPVSDPNYESVQEAQAKASFDVVTNQNGQRLIRDHFYEEVKPASEAETVKNRVLRSHQYEDIDNVKEQRKKLNNKNEDVWKRRSGAES